MKQILKPITLLYRVRYHIPQYKKESFTRDRNVTTYMQKNIDSELKCVNQGFSNYSIYEVYLITPSLWSYKQAHSYGEACG